MDGEGLLGRREPICDVLGGYKSCSLSTDAECLEKFGTHAMEIAAVRDGYALHNDSVWDLAMITHNGEEIVVERGALTFPGDRATTGKLIGKEGKKCIAIEWDDGRIWHG